MAHNENNDPKELDGWRTVPGKKLNLSPPQHSGQHRPQPEISDPFIRNVVAGYQSQPHFEINQTVPDTVVQPQEHTRAPVHNRSSKETDFVDVSAVVRQRLAGSQSGQQLPITKTEGSSVRPGSKLYRVVQAAGSIGNSGVTLAREIGVATQHVANQPCIIQPTGAVNCLVIDNSTTVVDLNRPQKLTPLVSVMFPPLSGLGTLLVERQNVSVGNLGGKVMLND